MQELHVRGRKQPHDICVESQNCLFKRKRLNFKFKCNNVALRYEHRVNAVLPPVLAEDRIRRYFPFCKEGFFHGFENQRIYYKKG